MADVEARLLSKMTDPQELAKIADSGLTSKVFEFPGNDAVFEFALDYWRTSQKAPTWLVMEAQFPSVPLDANVEETTEWLIDWLQHRFRRNQVQRIARKAAETMSRDDEAALKILRDDSIAAIEHVGHGVGEPPLYTDVAAMLDDELPEAPAPEILKRADGVPLFYRGEVNLLFGDPEHGKTWVGLAACAEVLEAGGRVMVVDIDHNGAAAIVSRLLMLDAPKEALRDPDRFRHCEPGEVAEVLQMVTDCAQWSPDVVMVDSTGELVPMFAANSDNGDDFTRVHARVLQPLADAGAAVVLVDHLAKGNESRKLGPGGTIAKRRTVGGLSLRVVRERPFTRAEGGVARLMVNKDRHGGVRDHCAAPKFGKDHDEQLAGMFIMDPTGGAQSWRVTPPQADASGTGDFRPTTLMERASRLVEEKSGALTRNQIAQEAQGKKVTLLLAVDLLEREGHLSKTEEKRQRYSLVKPYRQSEDLNSEHHLPLETVFKRHQVNQSEDHGGQDDE
jgi:hypothetical protein